VPTENENVGCGVEGLEETASQPPGTVNLDCLVVVDAVLLIVDRRPGNGEVRSSEPV
jgi:hypothetical protein